MEKVTINTILDWKGIQTEDKRQRREQLLVTREEER